MPSQEETAVRLCDVPKKRMRKLPYGDFFFIEAINKLRQEPYRMW